MGAGARSDEQRIHNAGATQVETTQVETGEDTVVTMEKKNLAMPDQVQGFEKGRLALITVGGATVGRAIFDPGWRWSQHVGAGIGATSCEVPHLGYVVSGRLMIEMNDGTRLEMGPGDVATIPAGHDGWTVGDEPCVFLEFPPPTGDQSPF
jgi:quercetin dioxygenase-like cupin family protein